MPAKITNLLTQGMPARIYITCFFQPMTGYALAKIIHGTPRVDKIYKWAKVMIQSGYLRRTDDGYEALVTPLTDQVVKVLSEKKVRLDFKEKKLLSLLLGSIFFREITRSFYNAMSEDDRRQVDLSSLMLEILPLLSSISLNAKNLADVPDSSVDEAISIFKDEEKVISRRQSNPGVFQGASSFGKMMNRYFETLGKTEMASEMSPEHLLSNASAFSLLHDIPNTMLEKLSQLHPISEYVTSIFALATSLLIQRLKQEAILQASAISNKDNQDDNPEHTKDADVPQGNTSNDDVE